MDTVVSASVSTSSVVQRERFYPLTITVHHQNNEGGDKTSQTPWEGDYMNCSYDNQPAHQTK